MNKRGISLPEVLLSVSIVGILAASFGFTYQDWSDRYDVESEIRELHTDLLAARMAALRSNREHYAVLDDHSYSIVEDTNDDGKAGAGDMTLPGFPKTLRSTLNKNSSGNKVYFSKRGVMSSLRTIWLASNVSADYDCVVVSMTRISLGRYNGTECVK